MYRQPPCGRYRPPIVDKTDGGYREPAACQSEQHGTALTTESCERDQPGVECKHDRESSSAGHDGLMRAALIRNIEHAPGEC